MTPRTIHVFYGEPSYPDMPASVYRDSPYEHAVTAESGAHVYVCGESVATASVEPSPIETPAETLVLNRAR